MGWSEGVNIVTRMTGGAAPRGTAPPSTPIGYDVYPNRMYADPDVTAGVATVLRDVRTLP